MTLCCGLLLLLVRADPATLCDKLVSYQLFDPTDSTAALAVMGTLFNRGVRGTEGSTSGGAIADVSMDAIWSGAVQYRENATVPQPFGLQGATPNYKTSSSAKDALADKWRRWLGSPSVLGCTASGYPAYSTSALGFGSFNQYQVHANMVISATQFAAFNAHLVTAFRSLGELQPTIDDDVAEFQALLNSFARNQVGQTQGASQVCTAAGCPCIAGVEGDNCDQVTAPPAESSTAPAEPSSSTAPAESSTASEATSTAPEASSTAPEESSTASPVDPGSDASSTASSDPPGESSESSAPSSPAASSSSSSSSTGQTVPPPDHSQGHVSSSSTGVGRPCIRGVDAMCAAAVSTPSMLLSSALLLIGAFQFAF